MTAPGTRRTIGRLEIQALALTQSRDQDVVRTGDLQKGLGLRPAQERDLLSRMATSGLVVRLSRGIYLAPRRMPPKGHFAPGSFLVLVRLMEAIGGRYQVGGPNAFHAHGFDDQVPNMTYVFNDKLSGERWIGGCGFVFIKVKESRIGGAEKVRLPEGPAYLRATKARALLDAIQYWPRFGTLPRAYGWVRESIGADSGLTQALVRCACKYGTSMASRRLGTCLELAGVGASVLRPLRARYGTVQTRIPYVPDRPVRGKTNTAWGVVVNG